MNKFKKLFAIIIFIVVINGCGNIFGDNDKILPKGDTLNTANSTTISIKKQLCKEAEETCLMNFSVEFCTIDLYKCISYIKN